MSDEFVIDWQREGRTAAAEAVFCEGKSVAQIAAILHAAEGRRLLLTRMPAETLAALPAEQREVIVLKIWHEYTFEEIGALLELSPNTVAGRYRYGMTKLRACLTATDYEQLEFLGDDAAILDSAPAVRQA